MITLTLPFALAAGSIAMGLGGYLAARSDVEHFLNERRREEEETVEKADVEKQEIVDIFRQYGVTAEECAPIVTALVRKPEAWRDFMMRFELGLEEPNPKRAFRSALTIGASYVVGGLVSLAPYMLMRDYAAGVDRVGRHYLAGIGRVWLCEGPLHWRSEAEGRAADGPGRQPGRGCGVSHRQIHCLM